VVAGPKHPVTDAPDEPFFDTLGRPILKDTVLAVAFVSGHSSYLRIGKVVGFTYENSRRDAKNETLIDDNGRRSYVETRKAQDINPQIVMAWPNQDEGGNKSWRSDLKLSKITADPNIRFLVIEMP
jgi:hypothetical protein